MNVKVGKALVNAAMCCFVFQSCAIAAGADAAPGAIPQSTDVYFAAGEAELQRKLAQEPILGEAKNIILFIGDGMSIPTIAAARIYAGQKRGLDGVSYKLAMEQLPYSALSRTYSHDFQVTDSAPSAVAMTTGVKTLNTVLGVNKNVIVGDCASAAGNEVMTIFEMAEMVGLATGIVTSTRVTHATPASAFAHTPHRDWEDDSDLPSAAKSEGCTDIAAQLIEWQYGDGFEVVLGGGREHMLPSDLADPEHAASFGTRTDGRNLIEEWIATRAGAAFVWNKAQFDAVDPASTAHLLGLFEPSMMNYEADREGDVGGEPSLAEMTGKAIETLSTNEDGFVLMVEGGRIDNAHHANNAARALEETDAFDAAITTALEMTDATETLIIATADHSHTLIMSGYPARNNPVLGLVANGEGEPAIARDGKPYTALGYANGPGATDAVRSDLSGTDTRSVDYLQQALVPLGAETHAGDDVAIFARGPYAHLFQGVVDQQFVYHVMAHASAIPAKARLK